MSVKVSCISVLEDFISKFEKDWQQRLLEIALAAPTYECVKKMILEARIDTTFLKRLFPQEYATDLNII